MRNSPWIHSEGTWGMVGAERKAVGGGGGSRVDGKVGRVRGCYLERWWASYMVVS